MTEREGRTRSGGTEDNVGDELDEAADRGKKPGTDASKEAVEEEQSTGDGVKDNVNDEWDESQER